MSAFDWPGLIRVGLQGLGLEPSVFWGLTPIELKIMLGLETEGQPLTRERLEKLVAAFPDKKKEASDGSN